MSYFQWTHEHCLKQEIGTKQKDPGILHIKLWSLIHWEEVVLEIMEHEKNVILPPCGFYYIVCLWQEKENGEWEGKREVW